MQICIHNSYRDIVAICDTHLLGQTFEEGKRILEVRQTFYEGEEISEPELIKTMKSLAAEDVTFNIIGKESVETALKAGIIIKEGIKEVKGVPFALVLL